LFAKQLGFRPIKHSGSLASRLVYLHQNYIFAQQRFGGGRTHKRLGCAVAEFLILRHRVVFYRGPTGQDFCFCYVDG
jgi:hypothetical protein